MNCAKERKWEIVSNVKLNKIPTKRKLIIGWNKRTKIGAIIGGSWGLITGMLYAWGVFALGFSGHGEIGTLSNNISAIWKIFFLPAYLTDIISGFLGNSLIIIASLLGFSFFIIWCIGIPILFGIIMGILTSAIIEKKIAVDKMTKNYIGLSLAGIICIFGMFGIIPLASAEDTGGITLDLSPDATVMKTAQEFQLMHIKVVKLTDETEVVFFESDIIEQKDINIPVSAGTYKLYVQLQGHRTIWELDNENRGYEVSVGSTTVVPLWENTLLKDVFADAPWRTETGNIPILVMVKDATGIAGDYDLGNVEIYLDEDCDKDNNEADDILLETVTKWYGVTVSGSFYNLYYPGDWYGITYLDPSEHDLSGEVCFHVVIREIGGWLDPDSDTHSHFNVNIASDTLPALTNWHAGDTHYHSSYTDNLVEFGFPVEATVEAGKVIGLDWNAITDHSFDIRDSKTSDSNHKFNTLKSDVSSYNTGSYRLILGEEVSCYGHENPPNPQVPRGVVHFLIFGMENFNNVRGTGLNFIPGGHDEKPEGGLTWNLEDVIDAVNSQGGVSYAAHPEGHRDASAAAFDRVPWITEDYDLVGYNGLQVWNMMDRDHERDLGLEQWKRLLLNGRKDIFIAGGSDAHGDFSHATTVIGPMDNAFGKVRTYIYCEEFTEEGILNALKNGNSIMTDGPLVIFNITNERSETAIIGNEITGYYLTLNIQWESTSEFGNISHIYIHRGIINETEVKISKYNLTPDNFSGAGVYSDLAGKVPLMKNGYIRINATTDKGYSVYTNPIWINSPASIISNVSVTGITANSTTITWDTNGPSDSLVKYSSESGNYTLLKYNHNNVTSHNINLTGLIPNTTYYFVVNSTDASCNSNESNEYNLRTAAIPDTTPAVVINTSPENLAINVIIETNITATFSEPMNSSTLNNNTVKVYSPDRIMGETFENTNGSWNSSNFQAFVHVEELAVWQTPIDDAHGTIGEGNLIYSTQPLLRDYHVYSNEGIEVEDSGNYSVIGWLGDENVVIDNGAGDWIISKLVFEQNSINTKTLHVGQTWDLGDGYSFKLLELDVGGNEAWVALNDSRGEIDNMVCVNQTACIFSADIDASGDNTPFFVTYLNKVNLTQFHIELKYTWLISQNTTEIQDNEQLGDFRVKTSTDKIIIENDEDMLLMRGSTIPLFDNFKFEVEDTPTVRYRLIHQTETPVEGDVSYNSSSRTVTFDPISNLNENIDYFPRITTGAEDLAGNGLTEDYIWTFKTVDTKPPTITDNTPTGTNIPVTTLITITFNESMNTTSVEDAFSIDPSVAGTLSWSGDTMNFTPTADLAYSTMHEVTIGTGAEDMAANPLAAAYIWDFTTGAEPDTTAPTVTDNTPTGTDIPVTTVITVTFNESMNTTSVEDAFSIDPSVAGSLSWSGDTITFTPTADLAYSTTYEVNIGTGAEDLAGNPLATTYIWNFTTEVIPTSNNIILNPGFESGTSPWRFYTSGTGTFTIASPGFEGNNAAKLALYSGSTNIQLYQTEVTLEPDTRYQLSFSGYSTTGHDVNVRLIKHVSPYTNYGLDFTADLGTSWQTFTTEFTTTGFTGTVNDGRLMFWLAPFATSGDKYYIDDVRLEKVDIQDTTPPTVAGNEPTGINVPVTTQIHVTFSEAMDQASTESAFSTSPVNFGSFSWNGNIMTYTPDSDFAFDTTYTVMVKDTNCMTVCHNQDMHAIHEMTSATCQGCHGVSLADRQPSCYKCHTDSIHTGARDLADNCMQTEHTWQFTTEIVPTSNNIILNPGFESGTTPWLFYTNGIGTFLNDASGDGSPYAGHITIYQEGSNVQLYQPGLVLEPNVLYRLSFKAYSNTGHDFSISLHKHESPYTNYGLSDDVVNLGTSWSEYSTQFTTSGFSGTVNDGRLRFWLSPYDAIGDHYFIDDVILIKV